MCHTAFVGRHFNIHQRYREMIYAKSQYCFYLTCFNIRSGTTTGMHSSSYVCLRKIQQKTSWNIWITNQSKITNLGHCIVSMLNLEVIHALKNVKLYRVYPIQYYLCVCLSNGIIILRCNVYTIGNQTYKGKF